jgi:predicted metal-dependent peptidase
MVRVIYCDTHVAGEEQFRPDDYPVTLKTKGGGGTRFAPVWEYAREHNIEPVCAVFCTDMGCYPGGWGDDPGYPVLWCATGPGAAPFGEVVRLRMEG